MIIVLAILKNIDSNLDTPYASGVFLRDVFAMRAFLFFLSVLFVSNTVWAINSSCAGKNCIGVVDVGSTGSRLHVYARNKNSKDQEVTEVWSKRIKPGFASLNPKASYLNIYLDDLFKDAPENFPVYFYASAGMRLLPSEHQKKYYDLVSSWFQQAPWQLKEARTITGREEGVFAWLSVHEHLKRRTPGLKMPKHLSVMDMGGASVQVVSAVDSKQPQHADDYIDVNLQGEKQTLFVHSFLGLGQTLVAEQFLEEPSCFPEGYLLPNDTLGKGDARHCVRHISKLINDVHEVQPTLHAALRPESSRVWYVIEGLAYLAREAPFDQNQTEILNDNLLLQAENKVCHRPWAVMKRNYPDEEYLSRSCLKASYYHALIKSYGIPSKEPIHLLPKTAGADWTLGVALHKV